MLRRIIRRVVRRVVKNGQIHYSLLIRFYHEVIVGALLHLLYYGIIERSIMLCLNEIVASQIMLLHCHLKIFFLYAKSLENSVEETSCNKVMFIVKLTHIDL